ncbi:hypothetical protein [Pseudovibrio sp. SPO723]|uniref:hypothetical protein n=1 Tax=Nesiotobacter zosterae TaxID=392721 RepID=UPI0029C18766|nr:hypothetical protein [Pseudovibrio sp. SPO723]MDX5593354.1 hypothetical protein [Pseudovibrio sp. SPO723]
MAEKEDPEGDNMHAVWALLFWCPPAVAGFLGVYFGWTRTQFIIAFSIATLPLTVSLACYCFVLVMDFWRKASWLWRIAAMFGFAIFAYGVSPFILAIWG